MRRAAISLYHYKARAYSPTLGRFLQTDPVGYADNMNLYAYADNDPLNQQDPTGMVADIIVTVQPIQCDALCWAQNIRRHFTIEALWNLPSVGPGGDTGAGGGGGGNNNGGVAERQEKERPDCNTALPNGKTIGDVVRGAIDDTLRIGGDVGSNTDYAASILAKMEMYTFPRGPLDFKNNFRGQGDPASLAAAGNFAYGAYVSALAGPAVSNFGAKLYGTVAGWLGLKSSKFLAPNGMSKSGAANVPHGNANAGCPR